ncbi:HAD family hydrolase [Streptomyces sp. NPDC098101]|uniref:HAD family hydrolase n=1 Tax=Streptomyces sp. NPDC098101 TaxID=3366096 RepID=UPI00381D306E
MLPASGGGGRAVAFFDVDETLIPAKSMVAFWRWWAAREPGLLPSIDALLARGREEGRRAEVNREYYRAFAGIPVAEFLAAGRRWYAEYRTGPDAFVTAALAALHEHRAAGHAVVLVSGSHRACLEQLAGELGAERLLCTEQDVGPDGRLTGGVVRPMIGEAKVAAVRAFLARSGIPARECFAYGDHSSDLPLLTGVGRAGVVGEDPVLLEHAERLGWRRLSARTGPWLPGGD